MNYLHRFRGAMPRALAMALFLFAIFVAAFSAHAEPRYAGRVQKLFDAPAESFAPIYHDAFGREDDVPASDPLIFNAPAFGRSRVAQIVRERALALGVPVGLSLAIMRHESGGDCAMRGRAGERGAMQVLPQTARTVGIAGNLGDCATGIEAGLRYLRLAITLHRQAGWCAVASAYNSGIWRGSRCTRYGRAIARAARMP
ncbi:MAG TPA: lytic transglycosylase domain-containing protein [Methylovirgula sp.]|nr:lytic transglycosylase domain-containing protein [Methylovirgula sp.]